MKSLDVEKLMGHDIGLADSYYGPSEQDLLKGYLSSVDELTIDSDTKMLQKQVVELEEKSRDSEYILKAKLQDSNTEVQTLKSQMTSVLEVLKLTKSKDGRLGRIERHWAVNAE